MTAAPDFTLGIEEEYLLVNAETGDLAEAPDALMDACKAELADQVSPEFLRCQIEVGTPVAADITEARNQLAHLRRTISRIAGEYGLAPISASCHPYADWRDQEQTDKARYNELARDLAATAQRMLICGMHVHVGLESRSMRIDLMNQLSYFLPHLLALSTSSPFWQGQDSGLASYRMTVFDGMPRTGLPSKITSWDEYERSVAVLTELGIIEDASKVWWDLRPSSKFPTLETRICDACPRLDDTIAVAALIQATMRMLWRLSRSNARWRQYDNFLLGENRWRAIRYGITEGMIDFGAHEIVPFEKLAEEWQGLIAPDVEALGSGAALQSLNRIVSGGTSAERQRRCFQDRKAEGASDDEALRAVVSSLIEEFREGL
ncbi:carboxylate-amine ligase [Paracoccus sediminicola]|uniref:carboxylate-amine ligase n=1 Tax=Paracoccus sediminicola TaxID=3017783 RepID=UPI0022F0AE6C|nr:carboxylate-amine ligase [Paracoccus sediminicola]WBU55631.1 carboxylate-amine ligase [Paracoccus sediminicola]